jgi:ribonuclease T2
MAKRVVPAAISALALAALLMAQTHRKSAVQTAGAQPFDYYVLSLSWAPEFCAQQGSAGNSNECAPGGKIGFIVHGLWPEAAAGKSPEFCGTAKPVPKTVVNYVLSDMLSPTLIQHEWAAHGVCTGLNPFAYFSSIVEVRASVQIPVQLTSIGSPTTESPGQIEAQFAMANSTFPGAAFRTSCPRSAFAEERICFDKSLKPRACTASVGECTATAITILPPS